MTDYMYADFQKMLNLTPDALSPENTERIMEHAIGLLNIYGAGLPEMTGIYGTKSLAVTGTQWAAVLHVSRMVYVDFVMDAAGTFTIQGLDVKSREYTSDPQKIEIVKEIALNLAGGTGEGEDPLEEIRLV